MTSWKYLFKAALSVGIVMAILCSVLYMERGKMNNYTFWGIIIFSTILGVVMQIKAYLDDKIVGR